MIDIQQVRDDTPVTERFIYFNNARVSPLSRQVAQAIQDFVEFEVTQSWADLNQSDILADTRAALARLMNSDESGTIITSSATHAFNLIVNGVDWKPGDNVIISDLAYRSIAIALLHLGARVGVEVRIVPSNNLLIEPAELYAMIDDRTRLVVVPFLATFSGVLQPVARIAELLAETDALLAVNGTQALGQVPVDLQEVECDFFFATSRKWLRGPRGLGVLHVKPALIPGLLPTNIGHTAALWTEPREYKLMSTSDRFHAGDHPFALMKGLAAAADYARNLGIESIFERNLQLGAYARQALSAAGIEIYDHVHGQTGTIPLQVGDRDPDEVISYLRTKDVVASVIYEENNLLALRRMDTKSLVRISISYFNTNEEIDHLTVLLENFKS